MVKVKTIKIILYIISTNHDIKTSKEFQQLKLFNHELKIVLKYTILSKN